MIDLLRAEWLKVRTTRSLFWTLVGAVVLVLIFVVAQLIVSSDLDKSIRSNQLLLLNALDAGSFFPLVLGILLMTNEFWHKTITSTFLASPQRERVVAAKLIVAALAGVAYVVGAGALTLLISLPWLKLENVDIAYGAGDVLELYGAHAATSAFAAVLGGAIGAIVRNQVATLVGALVWFFVVEGIVIALVPGVGKYLPSGAAAAIIPVEADEFIDLDLLTPGGGAALMLAYVVAFVAAGAALVTRRDVS